MDPNARSLDDAQRQLLVLLQQQEELSPALYRDLALYLQVLRDGLLHSVQQACFHLATQVVPERYNQLPAQRRQAFQQRLRQLVGRCSSLLTIEQLMALAAQQQRRDQRRQLKRQQELLSALIERAEASEDRPAPMDPEPAPPAPVGSVSLSLDLPLAADFFDNGVPGLSAPRPTREPDPTPEAEGRGSELSLMQGLFELASQGLSADAPSAEAERDGSESADGDGDESEEISDWSAPFQPEVTAAQIPRDPLLQVRWWAHFDRALRFRLRNLSHAVNVEMMRLGLAQGLLPVSLLDAALQARVEALPAPANLLRLALPISLSPAPPEAVPPTEVLTLLLRCSDLEFEQPKLRTCRQRLEQRRRALRTMAKRYRTWQRRVSALEAEQQWFQDSSPHPNPAADRS
ncbi:MAG: hypothetical protein FJ053_00010 [Cyanobacteria bacterium M_surface_10_m1_298]|nr:hypothetical protein [Cyanobacteria bacterium M_surface_10_m1_298]